MRYAILTADETRHRYFVNALKQARPPAAVCYQDTGYRPADTQPAEPNNRVSEILKHHFEERDRQERIFFGHDAELLTDSLDCRVCHVDARTFNTPETAAFLRTAGVDTVVVYGSSLLKQPLINLCPGRTINMHLGLSPYYRGTATNFYPLLNDEPEYVGVTIHHISPGIDSGDIIHQGRPDITANDMPHTVGCKTILVGIRLMIQTLNELEAGTLRSVPQWKVENPRLYLRKDYHPEQVLELYRMIEDGLFVRYVARKDRVESQVRLIP